SNIQKYEDNIWIIIPYYLLSYLIELQWNYFIMNNSKNNNLVKVSIIGFPAVGKTTIMQLLSQNKINRRYNPTQGLDLKSIQSDHYKINIWDFGGQKAYLKINIKNYLVGSDIVFVVSDSTPKNALNSRELIDFSKDILEDDCPIIGIANKQDLCKSDGRMNANRVENLLQIKTHGLIAIDPNQRLKMLSIIKKELDQILISKQLNEIDTLL
ncbi:MAG: GTP-binding protein, partial [Candidatus Lokiarchaeota archaeon]|nr:GTP-binding protein [Candidatus Lokiarchaeota archaeon]